MYDLVPRQSRFHILIPQEPVARHISFKPLPRLPYASSTMADVLDIFNTILAVLGFLAIVCQLFSWILHSRLPSTKLRVLQSTLAETQHTLNKCVEEGRLSSNGEAEDFQRNLNELSTRINAISLQTLQAKTFTDDLRNMWKGLSRSMDSLREEVILTRSNISASSASSTASLVSSSDTAISSDPVPSLPCLVDPNTEASEANLFQRDSDDGALGQGHWSPAPRYVNSMSSAGTGSWSQLADTDRDRRSVSSPRTRCTPALQRKKQSGAIARTRALARSVRLF
ncbi:hypothetical protein C8Q79DRAFT_969197 [Trametes meyenii]|nr:hypothetical protein C8Q79DRAFT_969197 [Trametes meyenii]